MWRKHSISLLVLIAISTLAIGYPHGSDSWFSFLNSNQISKELFYIYRLPEIITAFIAGSSLAISGLILQTILNNPLAGPSILGITSGSHFMVAIVLMGGSLLGCQLLEIGLAFASMFGAFALCFLILILSLRVKSMVSLLLIGVMLGTLFSAITNIILMKADAVSVKAFSIWGMGSLKQVTLEQTPLLIGIFVIGFLFSILLSKSLNALVLGEKSASVLGIQTKSVRWKSILVVSLLTGVITSFCGPIGFVGLIVPNLVRMYYKTANHIHLIIASSILGASTLIFCSLLIRVFEPFIVLPINSLTSFIGAPIVLYLLLKKIKNA